MRNLFIYTLFLTLAGCSTIIPEPYEPSVGHIKNEEPVEPEQIPQLVEQVPVLPEPAPPVELERYTVVVHEVPVKELLFALARDAEVNIDIDPTIEGVVTINAVEQTLPQLLERISRQVTIRYEIKQNNLIVRPDEPFFRTYKVDYLYIDRDTKSTITTATQIGSGIENQGGGTGGNTSGGRGSSGASGSNSTTDVTSVTTNHFWETLVNNILAILGESGSSSKGAGKQGLSISQNVIPHPETGILTVRARSKEHEQIQELIDHALISANRQVLIQATIVEVALSDQFSAGIDWSIVNFSGEGLSVVSNTFLGFPAGTSTSLLLDYTKPNLDADSASLDGALTLLEEFGDISVLSSPQIMALNNQTALLKVVNNEVYFTVDQETSQTQTNLVQTFETTVHTVPVGLVMSLTAQISDNDSIILNVRPTVSRIADRVRDPNPALTVDNLIPVIQVREMESILRMSNGQIAVLGGLMQDDTNEKDAAIPGFSKIPILGEIFKSRNREFRKTELVIFLRPVVVKNPSLNGDLQQYKSYLQSKLPPPSQSVTGGE